MTAVKKISRPAKTLNDLQIEYGVISRALPGEPECGDKYIIEPSNNGVLVGVVDGLGHGNEAANAARIAIETLKAHANESVTSLINHCHNNLKDTRGVVMCLASIRVSDETVTWIGVGNVEAMIVRADSTVVQRHEHIMLRGGVVGYNLPVLQATELRIAKGDLMIIKTDGLESGYGDEYPNKESAQHIAERIGTKYIKGTDDALVLVLRYGSVMQ
ncbi:MAG: SpoIIE family protein phosphatase [Bacteroidota bacterium]